MKPALRLTGCAASELPVCVQDFFFVVEVDLPNLQSGKSTPDTRLPSSVKALLLFGVLGISQPENSRTLPAEAS